MAKTITVRDESKPLLGMVDGDGTKHWMYDLIQNAFFCIDLVPPHRPATAYRRERKGWLFWLVQPGQKWEPVIDPETAKILDEMHEALIEWQIETIRNHAEVSK